PGYVSPRTCKAFHISGCDRIDRAYHHNGSRFCRFFCSSDYDITSPENDVDFLLNELLHERRHSIQPALCIATFNQDIFFIHVTEISQPLTEGLEQWRRSFSGARG